MNYTEKYHLPQWEKTDRVLMEDFNRMCLDMEAGLDKTAADAAGAVKKAESNAASAAAKAQATADTAVSKANTAQATANNAYCPGKYPYVVGEYTGTGELAVPNHVSLGFAPRFVLVTGKVLARVHVSEMGGKGIDIHPILLTENGFDAIQYDGDWPQVNAKGVRYVFVAFP